MVAVCLLPLLLLNAAATADTASFLHGNASESSIFAEPSPIVSSETNVMVRRRLADVTSLANDEAAKTATKKTSTADLVAKAKEEAKKKIDEALKTAVSDNDKVKPDNKNPKVPKFSVHKKPISSASLTKVADSVAKAAAVEKEKTKDGDQKKKKDADDTKVTAERMTSTVVKTTADAERKDTKAESTHADEAKKDTKPTTKAGEKTKPDNDYTVPFSHTAKKPTSSIPATSDATTSVAAATKTSDVKKDEPTSSHAKPHLPKPAKPNSIKDIDRYKESLKKTRDDLLKNNPKLKKKIEAKKKAEDYKKKQTEKSTEIADNKNAADADMAAGGKDKLNEMAKQMKEKRAFAKLRNVFRKEEDKQQKTNIGKKDEKDAHQRRSRPLRPGERVFSKIPIVKRAYKKSPLEDAFSDATLSFVEGLKHGIFTDNDNSLDHRRKEALRDWLSLLSATLPPELALHMLINDLLANIDIASQKKSKLLKILKKHPIKERKWSANCSRSGKRSETGGFSCGFWKLFHIISIGLAEQRGGIDVSKTPISPMKAADILREYMALFFGCELCSRNFLSQYDQCAYRRCDRLSESAQDLEDYEWYEFALYLWEFHNGISVNVANEKAGDNKAMGRDDISAIYPSLEECYLCLNDDGTFADEHVTRHLVETYWSGPDGDSKDDLLKTYERSLEKSLLPNSILFLSLSMLAVAAVVLRRRYIKRTGLHKKFDGPSANRNTAPKKWRRI